MNPDNFTKQELYDLAENLMEKYNRAASQLEIAYVIIGALTGGVVGFVIGWLVTRI